MVWETGCPPLSWRISLFVIWTFLVDPDLPSVDQAGTYSSTYPISRFTLLFVRCTDRSHTVQESFLINMVSTFVGAFNAEVTSSHWTIYTLYSRMSPILLAFFFEGALEVAFDDIPIFLLKSWEAKDRAILGCIYGPFGLSLFVLGNPYPWHGPWVLMGSGPGCEFSGSTIAPQNPAVRLLGRIRGFWWHQASVKACQSLSPTGSRDSSSARDTFWEPLEGETCLH